MKFLLNVATLLAACVVITSAKPHHELPPHLKAAFDTCLKEQGLTKEEVHDRWKDHEEKTEDCFAACFDKQLGVIGADGSINKEAALNNLPPHISEEEATKIVDACFEQKGDNDCQTTVLYRKCTKNLLPRPPRHPEHEKVHESCKEKLSLTEEDVEKLDKARGEAKEDCYAACMAKGLGFMNEDGSFNKEKLVERVPPHLTKEELTKVVDECTAAKGENDCETTVLSYACFKKNRFPFGLGLHGPHGPHDGPHGPE